MSTTLSELLTTDTSLKSLFQNMADLEIAALVRKKRKNIALAHGISADDLATSSLVSESLLKILQTKYNWDGCASELRRKMSLIVMHRIIDKCKLQQQEISLKEHVKTDTSHLHDAILEKNHSVLAKEIELLAQRYPDEAHAITLKIYQSFPISEIAIALNCSARKVDTLLKEAQKKLERRMKG